MRLAKKIVNLDTIASNYIKVRKSIDKKIEILAIVKANAYGHGIEKVGPRLYEEGARYFGVAYIDEAIKLLNAFRNMKSNAYKEDAHILILGYSDFNSMCDAVDNNIEFCVGSEYELDNAIKASKKMSKIAKVHIAINTGMNRLGFEYDEDPKKIFSKYEKYLNKSLKFAGIFSHFAMAENDEYTKFQIENFKKFVDKAKKYGYSFDKIHIFNSVGATKYTSQKIDLDYNMVRIGKSFYGYLPMENDLNLEYAMDVIAMVTTIRNLKKGSYVGYNISFKSKSNMKIAILAIGYADGYIKEMQEKGYVLILDKKDKVYKKAKIIGYICMDQMIIDITGINVDIEDYAYILHHKYLTPQDLKRDDINTTLEICTLWKRVEEEYIGKE